MLIQLSSSQLYTQPRVNDTVQNVRSMFARHNWHVLYEIMVPNPQPLKRNNTHTQLDATCCGACSLLQARNFAKHTIPQAVCKYGFDDTLLLRFAVCSRAVAMEHIVRVLPFFTRFVVTTNRCKLADLQPLRWNFAVRRYLHNTLCQSYPAKKVQPKICINSQ